MSVCKRRLFLEKIRSGTIDYNGDIPQNIQSCHLQKIGGLRQHQLHAVHRMMGLEMKEEIQSVNEDVFETNYGILCDKVGSGKSIMILGLLTLNPVCQGIFEKQVVDYSYCYNIGYRIVTKRLTLHLPVNIIVIPYALCNQWSRYITDYTRFSFIILKNLRDITQYKESINTSNAMIVIVSNKIYNDFAEEFRDKSFSRVIFDEVDTIDIPNTRRIRAGFYWFISASVANIVYARRKNKGFLSDIMRMNQSIFNHFLYVKNHDENVDMSMKLSEPKLTIIKCKVHRILKIIGNIIPERVQLMISGGDIEGAMSELNVFNDTSDNILQIVTENFQRQLQNEKMKLDMNTQLIFTTEAEKDRVLYECQKNITNFEKKIDLIRKRIEEENVDPITYDTIENPVITKCCQNKFDAKSILDYIRFKSRTAIVFCPMCKSQPFSVDSFIHMVGKIVKKPEECVGDEWESIHHNKIENLRRLYVDNKIGLDEKVLIMTQYNNGFGSELKNMLDDMKIKFMSLQTPGVRLMTAIERYQKGDINCLILNTNHYGAGINLEMTDHVVFMHKMSSEIEMQAIGRAQRIGRKGILKIWKLLDKYEYE